MSSSPLFASADAVTNNTKTRAFIRFFPSELSSQLGKGYRFTVKDNYSVKGYPVTCGFSPPINPIADTTATSISKLLENDILLAACNLDPGAIGAKGENAAWGKMQCVTKSSVPLLGSSGGSALSIYEGYADYSLVTDIAGSARLPALFTQLYGLKLRSRTIPRDGVYLYHDTIDTPGIIGSSLTVLKDVIHSFSSLKDIQKQNDNESHSHLELISIKELYREPQKLQDCHIKLVAKSVSSAPWLKKTDLSPEIAALRKIAATTDLHQIDMQYKEILSEYHSEFSEGKYFFTEIVKKDYANNPKLQRKVRALFIIPNLLNWPALLLPLSDEKALHITGNISEDELLIIAQKVDIDLLQRKSMQEYITLPKQ